MAPRWTSLYITSVRIQERSKHDRCHVFKRVHWLAPCCTLDTCLDVDAQTARVQFAQVVDRALSNVDALVLPTTRTTAPPFGEITTVEDVMSTIGNTSPFNATGNPALSIPCGHSDGHPVGLQIVADRLDEQILAALGGTVERTVTD